MELTRRIFFSSFVCKRGGCVKPSSLVFLVGTDPLGHGSILTGSPIVLPVRQMLSSTQIECFGWALGGIVHLEVSTSKLEPTEVLWIALHHASKHSPTVPVRLDRMSKATQSQGLEHSEAKAPRWLRHTARFTKNAPFEPCHHSRVTLGYKSQIQGMALPVSAPRQDLAAGPIKDQSGYCLQTFSFRISAVGLTAKWHIWTLF